MILPIVKYGHPVLHTPAKPVDAITPDITRLIDDMVETMYAAPGIGLAATQVGVPLRVLVIDLSLGRQAGSQIHLINPVFIERGGAQYEDEGCLSVPGYTARVHRDSQVSVEGLNRHGEQVRHDATGLLARAFQHEIDHLGGLVYLDHLRGLKRELILRGIRKQQRHGTW
ncbi:MAG: peptide deformylase [Vicinamibacterales bacterium]